MARNTRSVLLCEPRLIGWPSQTQKVLSPFFLFSFFWGGGDQQNMSCDEPVRRGSKQRRLPSSHLPGSLMGVGGARVCGGRGARRTVACREQVVHNLNLFVYLFASNSSLKAVGGSRSPLIRSSTVFALLRRAPSSGGPHCVSWPQTHNGETVLVYLI